MRALARFLAAGRCRWFTCATSPPVTHTSKMWDTNTWPKRRHLNWLTSSGSRQLARLCCLYRLSV